MVRQITQTNAYSNFLLGLKAPETQRQWPKRLKFFLDFVEITGNDSSSINMNVDEKYKNNSFINNFADLPIKVKIRKW